IDDLTAGWDFINNDNNPTDDHGHGTNVAGIVLASGNNAIGYAGVNWNSRVMICKALNSTNSGSYAAIAGSIYYAVDNGAKVISMSIGGSGNSVTLSDAIDYCYNNGVVLVACMMNFNNNVNYYPAAYTNVIAVGSTDPDDKRSNPFFWSNTSGSNYGNHIDLVAPGNYMYGLSYSSDTNYGSYWGGTSQATP
ncbi:MAG: S8 family serine peptidase, partial [Flavobacteriaceae bacterium]